MTTNDDHLLLHCIADIFSSPIIFSSVISLVFLYVQFVLLFIELQPRTVLARDGI